VYTVRVAAKSEPRYFDCPINGKLAIFAPNLHLITDKMQILISTIKNLLEVIQYTI